MNEENMKKLMENMGVIKQTLDVDSPIIKKMAVESKDSIENLGVQLRFLQPENEELYQQLKALEKKMNGCIHESRA